MNAGELCAMMAILALRPAPELRQTVRNTIGRQVDFAECPYGIGKLEKRASPVSFPRQSAADRQARAAMDPLPACPSTVPISWR